MKINLQNKKTAVAFFAMIAVFLTTISVCGKTLKPEDDKLVVTGDWEICGQVNKLYDTPMGSVYDFTMSDYFKFTPEYLKDVAKGKYALHSIQFDLRKFMDRQEKIRRFIVLDFKIRTFPAISTVKNPMLRYTLTRSAVDPSNINGYQSLNGYLTCEDILLSPGIFSPYTPSGFKHRWAFGIDSGIYWPHYEVTTYRVILDTYKDGINSVNFNGNKTIGQNAEDPKGHNSGSGLSPQGKWIPPQTENVADFVVPVRSFGLCIQIDPDIMHRGITYRTILEVSRPVVTLTDHEEALRALPPVEKMADYPYGGYITDLKKINMAGNPDLIYACAMHLLNGEDLPLGVEMLKKAADSQHIFAMYQLGVCYFRGIGVEPDFKQSLEWLKHATEYGLPDAWALSAVVQIRSAQSPYLSDYIRGAVKQGLNSSGYNTKHDNWVLSGGLNNGGAGSFVKCSPKLEFLQTKHDYIFSYYKDNVDPKILPPPPKEVPALTKQTLTEVKNQLNFNNSTLKKPSGKEKTTVNFEIGPPAKLKENKLPDKYYDIRVEGLGYHADSDELFKDVIANNYIPAILYQGRTTLLRTNFREPDISLLYIDIPAASSSDALEKAAAVFDKGAQLGSRECETEALHCRVRLGKVKKEDFTPELDVRLADYPLYHMLKYMVENPDAPGAKEFLSRKYEDARQIWRKNPTAWNNFLLGAEALYQYYDYGFDTAWYRLYYRDIKDVETAFKYLDDAAKQNIAPALYLCGKQLLEGMRSKGQMDEFSNKNEGVKLLKAAEQAGYAKASYLLVKQQFISNPRSTDEKWIEKLKPALDAKDADAWLLAGDFYSRLKSSGNDKKALDAYEKAAELGSIRAWHSLGMRYYNKPSTGKEKEQNKLKAAECWQKFDKLDREARSQDINDVYWPGIKKPPVFKLGDGDYSIKGLSDQEVRRYYETY